jgi:hypothetical protein
MHMRVKLYLLAGASVLIVASTVLFAALRNGPSETASTWEAASGFLPWNERESLERPDERTFTGNAVDLGVVPLPEAYVPTEESFDELASLLSSLVNTAPATGTDATFTPSSYAFIPQGILSISGARPRTPTQQELYEYGNTLGLALAAFADLHTTMIQTLKDQAEDRANPSKAAAVVRLGDDFIALGADIEAMGSVPSPALATHAALAAAYKDAGAKMKFIPAAQGDTAFLDAINAYNASAEKLSKSLIGAIDLFQTNDVTFSPTDAGSIFTFSANPSF